MNEWKTLSSTVVHKTPWIELVEDKLVNHLGNDQTYTYLRLPHAAVTIVAVNEADEILMQRNYRATLGKTLWELPSGHSDGEDLLEAAKRELLEEAGLASDTWVELGDTYLAAGVAHIRQCFFAATDVREVTDARDEDEPISDQRFVRIHDIQSMLDRSEIQDGDTEIALRRYLQHMKAETTQQEERG